MLFGRHFTSQCDLYKKSWKNQVNREEIGTILFLDITIVHGNQWVQARRNFIFTLNQLEGHSVIYHAYMFNSFLEGTRPTWDATDFDIPSWTEIGRIQLDELDGHTFGTTSSTILFQTSQHFTSTLQHANRVDLTLKILIPPRLEPADCRERR